MVSGLCTYSNFRFKILFSKLINRKSNNRLTMIEKNIKIDLNTLNTNK